MKKRMKRRKKKLSKTKHYHNREISYLEDTIQLPMEISTKIISKSGKSRTYRDVVLLTPGDWSDSQTRAPVRYTPDLLKSSFNNWSRNYLNLDHMWTALNRVGWVENVRCRNDGAMLADIKISMVTQNGKDIVEQIENGLINELSVELLSDDIWDNKERIIMANDIEFIGCAIVTDGACRETKIK